MLKTAFLAILFLSSCGVEYKDERKAEDYTYSYTLNGCSTGKQAFETREAYCKGLIDDQKNNLCAKNQRYLNYRSNCEQFGALDDILKKRQEEAADRSPFPGIAGD